MDYCMQISMENNMQFKDDKFTLFWAVLNNIVLGMKF